MTLPLFAQTNPEESTAADPGSDAAKVFRAAMDERLKGHQFFSKISYTVDDSHPPFLFYIQRPPNDQKQYQALIVNQYLPFLKVLVEQWEELYVGPDRLIRDPAMPTYAIAVLDSAGSYMNFRQAINDPSLANARAHYTPSLRLAVTYKDAFSPFNTVAEERVSLLHEVVHAMQHGHAAAEMPKPVWYNEGLACYRASSTNLADSLREPPLMPHDHATLSFAYGSPRGKTLRFPIKELVTSESYAQVIDQASRRLGKAIKPEVLMAFFYSQSQMFVRFLHGGRAGSYRAGFLAYMREVQSGQSGWSTFQNAFGVADAAALATMENEWLEFVQQAVHSVSDETTAAARRAQPLPAPAAFDPTPLAWKVEDAEQRLLGARQLCAVGRYEVAIALVPGDAEVVGDALTQLCQRERLRVQALLELRDSMLADFAERHLKLQLVVDGKEQRFEFLRREEDQLVFAIDKVERRLPLSTMDPSVLLREGNKAKRFQGDQLWLQVWLRWLRGEPLGKLRSTLALENKGLKELRLDLTKDFDAGAEAPVRALGVVLALPMLDEPQKAAEVARQFEALVTPHAKTPLFAARQKALQDMARAVAERGFRSDDIGALASGIFTKLEDGRVRVLYSTDRPAANDFTTLADPAEVRLALPDRNVAYSGPSGLVVAGEVEQLIGNCFTRWIVPLRGPQEVEFDFLFPQDGLGLHGLLLCQDDGGQLIVHFDGTVGVVDEASNIDDLVGTSTVMYLKKKHNLKVVHDGAGKLTVWRDGKQTAELGSVGQRLRGHVGFYVQSSTPVFISNMTVTGVPDPDDLLQIRDRVVEAMVKRIWP
ncbi:MAG: hypothetical protein ABL997_04000 [Planctomycetota bacterium]